MLDLTWRGMDHFTLKRLSSKTNQLSSPSGKSCSITTHHVINTWLGIFLLEIQTRKVFHCTNDLWFSLVNKEVISPQPQDKHHPVYLPEISSEESSSCGLLGLLLLFGFSGLVLDGSFTRICCSLRKTNRGYFIVYWNVSLNVSSLNSKSTRSNHTLEHHKHSSRLVSYCVTWGMNVSGIKS